MNEDRKIYDFLFNDPAIRQALSSIGVYATNYATGETVQSNIWTEQKCRLNIPDGTNDWLEYIHPHDRDRVREEIQRVTLGESSSFNETFRLMTQNKSYIWIKSSGNTVSYQENGRPLLYIGSDTDITELKQAEARLRHAHQQELRKSDELETIRQAAAIISSSLYTQETVRRILEQTHRIIPYDQATVQLLKGSQLRVVGGWGFPDIESILKLRFPYPEKGSLSTLALQNMQPILTNNIAEDFPAFVQPDQSKPIRSWIGVPLIARGEVIGLIAMDSFETDFFSRRQLMLAGTIGDHISIALDNARMHEKTYQMAMEDALTGIGSRHRFQIEGRLLYENAKRSEHVISVAMLDVDHFKKFNDTFGHDVGDEVLRRIAQVCSAELRTTDLLARYGGEEFVVLFPETEIDEAITALERVRERVQKLTIDNVDSTLSISIGVVCEAPAAEQPFEQMITKADVALYFSKENGRNRISRWYDSKGETGKE